MTDVRLFRNFFKKMGILNNVTVFTDKQFLADDAIKAGATFSYSLRGVLDFYFDFGGNFVGTHTGNIGGWKKRSKHDKIVLGRSLRTNVRNPSVSLSQKGRTAKGRNKRTDKSPAGKQDSEDK